MLASTNTLIGRRKKGEHPVCIRATYRKAAVQDTVHIHGDSGSKISICLFRFRRKKNTEAVYVRKQRNTLAESVRMSHRAPKSPYSKICK